MGGIIYFTGLNQRIDVKLFCELQGTRHYFLLTGGERTKVTRSFLSLLFPFPSGSPAAHLDAAGSGSLSGASVLLTLGKFPFLLEPAPHLSSGHNNSDHVAVSQGQ